MKLKKAVALVLSHIVKHYKKFKKGGRKDIALPAISAEYVKEKTQV